MDFARRRSELAAAFESIDAMLVLRDIHVRYLTGLMSSNATAVITAERAIVLTDGRYALMAQKEAPGCEIVIERHVVRGAIAQAAEAGAQRLGFEADSVVASNVVAMENTAREYGVELVPLTNTIEDVRLIKDEDEVAAVAEACHITDRAWLQTISDGVIGKSEREIAGIVEMYFRKFGAEDRAFESIVATGPNSAIPHHHPTERIVERGDFLKIDCGAKFNGYHADMTRTVVVGAAADWQKEIYREVALAQQKAMDACVPGADSFAIDGIARASIEAAGYGHTLVHQCGHGVGLEIHERPFLGRQDGILRPRMPITVEPGIYLEGRGGVRIEDTILVVEDGYRRLTESTRDLLEI